MAQMLSPDIQRKSHAVRDALLGWVGFALIIGYMVVPLLRDAIS